MSDFIITGTSVIVRTLTNKVLLGLRKGGWKPGTVGFPGGKVSKGERLVVAAARELKEETGIIRHIDSLKYFTFTEDIVDDYHFITHYFIDTERMSGRLITPTEPDKCEWWKYFAREELPNNLFEPVRNLLIKRNCEGIWDGSI